MSNLLPTLFEIFAHTETEKLGNVISDALMFLKLANEIKEEILLCILGLV